MFKGEDDECINFFVLISTTKLERDLEGFAVTLRSVDGGRFGYLSAFSACIVRLHMFTSLTSSHVCVVVWNQTRHDPQCCHASEHLRLITHLTQKY